MPYSSKGKCIKTTAIFLAVFAALITFFWASRTNGHDHFYRTMTIDPRSLQVTFSGPLRGYDETSGPFFWPFTMHTGDYSVGHYDGKSAYPNRVRYNVFTVSPTNQLEERDKWQELAKGPFGTIYAETKSVYGLGNFAGDIELHVLHYGNEVEHEPPIIIPAPPASSPRNLDALSLIRVFRSGWDYIVVIGNYTSDGRLVSHVTPTWTKAGDWIAEGNANPSHDRDTYGFPTRIPIATYLRKPHPVWKKSALPNILNIVNLHYDRGKWVRQDIFVSTAVPKTRFLTFVMTKQDIMLAPIDRKMSYKVII